MDQATLFQKLSPLEKKWFAIALGGMVIADGAVDETELSYLQKAISFLEASRSIDLINSSSPINLAG